MALFPGLPRWAGTSKVKPIWILLKQEKVSGSSFSWAMCKSAPHSRQITTPAPHHSVFYRPDALPATQPTASKHWRQVWASTTTHLITIVIVHYNTIFALVTGAQLATKAKSKVPKLSNAADSVGFVDSKENTWVQTDQNVSQHLQCEYLTPVKQQFDWTLLVHADWHFQLNLL